LASSRHPRIAQRFDTTRESCSNPSRYAPIPARYHTHTWRAASPEATASFTRTVFTPARLVQDHLSALAIDLGQRLRLAGLTVTTAESCTGGWIAKCITDVAGSSGWFQLGYVTYSNAAKQDALGVPAETLAAHGAVSEPVVRAMALGALRRGCADIAVAVSGIAGPAGGSAAKPVGTVCLAWAHGDALVSTTECFAGDRDAVRKQSVERALRGLIALLPTDENPKGQQDAH
jgi:nicotinamide-nucleotide amidase